MRLPAPAAADFARSMSELHQLVGALADRGRFTAMIGDGVNDVPALKQARLAVGMGSVLVPDELQQGELVAFRPSSAAIEFEAQFEAEFVLGSAVPHDRDLILGSHSVHTSTEALREAEARISAIQTRLIQQGRL